MLRRARDEGWEGLIVKEAHSPYHSGKRSPVWRKMKLLKQQEFVVGGWTAPRQTRSYFGSLLLGITTTRVTALGRIGGHGFRSEGTRSRLDPAGSA
jgi:bifunctional non-homologous end joining protein LigD